MDHNGEGRSPAGRDAETPKHQGRSLNQGVGKHCAPASPSAPEITGDNPQFVS